MSGQFLGNFRAKVIETAMDKNDYGAIKVFVPGIHSKIDPDYSEDDGKKLGIIAYPANGFAGGYNEDSKESHYQGNFHVPPKGSWWWVFFEGGLLERCFYFAPVHNKHAKLPPENRDGSEPHKITTVFKSNQGRAIVISDDSDNARTEITGKKSNLKEGPSGNKDSVYKIEGNQNSILIDERQGKEKILIQTTGGDFINLDIKKGEIHIKSKKDIVTNAGGSFYIQAEENVHIKAGESINLSSGSSMSLNSGKGMNIKAGMNLTLSASMLVNIDGMITMIQGGFGSCMGGGSGAKSKNASGSRDGGGGFMGNFQNMLSGGNPAELISGIMDGNLGSFALPGGFGSNGGTLNIPDIIDGILDFGSGTGFFSGNDDNPFDNVEFSDIETVLTSDDLLNRFVEDYGELDWNILSVYDNDGSLLA